MLRLSSVLVRFIYLSRAWVLTTKDTVKISLLIYTQNQHSKPQEIWFSDVWVMRNSICSLLLLLPLRCSLLLVLLFPAALSLSFEGLWSSIQWKPRNPWKIFFSTFLSCHILKMQCFSLWEDTICLRGIVLVHGLHSLQQPCLIFPRMLTTMEFILIASPSLQCSKATASWLLKIQDASFLFLSVILTFPQCSVDSKCLRKVLSVHSSIVFRLLAPTPALAEEFGELAGRWRLAWRVEALRIISHHARNHLATIIIAAATTTTTTAITTTTTSVF